MHRSQTILRMTVVSMQSYLYEHTPTHHTPPTHHIPHTHTTHSLHYLNFMKLLSDNHDRKGVMGRGVMGRQMMESDGE